MLLSSTSETFSEVYIIMWRLQKQWLEENYVVLLCLLLDHNRNNYQYYTVVLLSCQNPSRNAWYILKQRVNISFCNINDFTSILPGGHAWSPSAKETSSIRKIPTKKEILKSIWILQFFSFDLQSELKLSVYLLERVL